MYSGNYILMALDVYIRRASVFMSRSRQVHCRSQGKVCSGRSTTLTTKFTFELSRFMKKMKQGGLDVRIDLEFWGGM